jgi:hypothetical protein
MKFFFIVLSLSLLAASCNSQPNNQPNPVPISGAPIQPVSPPVATSTPPTETPSLVASVSVSASTNTRAYTLSIKNDGSVDVLIQNPNTSQNFPAGTADIKTFAGILAQVGDVSLVTDLSADGKQIVMCAKSVSFGTSMTITYNGKTSGDLDCAQNNKSLPNQDQQLISFINTLINQLQIKSGHNQISL